MKTKQITYTGLFAAFGILLPQLLHMVGGPGIGSMLLPMHIPVFVGAMLLGPVSGMSIAAISIVVGASLGMPAMPMALFMFFELVVYGLVSGLLYKRLKVNVYASLIVAMIAGRLVEIGVIRIFLALFDTPLPPVFGTLAMFSGGIIGMVLQLILIPILVTILSRYMDNSRPVYQ